MAGAMLARWLDCGLPADRVLVVRPSGKPVGEGVAVTTALTAPVVPGTTVLFGFKPQQLSAIAPEIGPWLGTDSTLVSILAGVPVTRLREAFPDAGDIVRCMPNLPVRIGRGVSILHADTDAGEDTRRLVAELGRSLGLVEWLEDEALFDAATALAGCGPAFVYRFIDALASAGSSLGLDPPVAARMALATVEGAAASAAAAVDPPAALADAVASKGGMTREGLDVLDQPEGLVALLAATLRAARDRGAELAKSAS